MTRNVAAGMAGNDYTPLLEEWRAECVRKLKNKQGMTSRLNSARNSWMVFLMDRRIPHSSAARNEAKRYLRKFHTTGRRDGITYWRGIRIYYPDLPKIYDWRNDAGLFAGPGIEIPPATESQVLTALKAFRQYGFISPDSARIAWFELVEKDRK